MKRCVRHLTEVVRRSEPNWPGARTVGAANGQKTVAVVDPATGSSMPMFPPVLLKLLLTAISTILLLVHTRLIGYVASVAAETSLLGGRLGDARRQLVVDAGAALLVLLTTTALSIYKPQGVTPDGWRRQQERRAAR